LGVNSPWSFVAVTAAAFFSIGLSFYYDVDVLAYIIMLTVILLSTLNFATKLSQELYLLLIGFKSNPGLRMENMKFIDGRFREYEDIIKQMFNELGEIFFDYKSPFIVKGSFIRLLEAMEKIKAFRDFRDYDLFMYYLIKIQDGLIRTKDSKALKDSNKLQDSTNKAIEKISFIIGQYEEMKALDLEGKEILGSVSNRNNDASSPVFHNSFVQATEIFDLDIYDPYKISTHIKLFIVVVTEETDPNHALEPVLEKYIERVNPVHIVESQKFTPYLRHQGLKVKYNSPEIYKYIIGQEEFILTGGHCTFCLFSIFKRILDVHHLRTDFGRKVIHMPIDAIYGVMSEISQNYLSKGMGMYYELLRFLIKDFAIYYEGRLIHMTNRKAKVIFNVWRSMPEFGEGINNSYPDLGSSPIEGNNQNDDEQRVESLAMKLYHEQRSSQQTLQLRRKSFREDIESARKIREKTLSLVLPRYQSGDNEEEFKERDSSSEPGQENYVFPEKKKSKPENNKKKQRGRPRLEEFLNPQEVEATTKDSRSAEEATRIVFEKFKHKMSVQMLRKFFDRNKLKAQWRKGEYRTFAVKIEGKKKSNKKSRIGRPRLEEFLNPQEVEEAAKESKSALEATEIVFSKFKRKIHVEMLKKFYYRNNLSARWRRVGYRFQDKKAEIEIENNRKSYQGGRKSLEEFINPQEVEKAAEESKNLQEAVGIVFLIFKRKISARMLSKFYSRNKLKAQWRRGKYRILSESVESKTETSRKRRSGRVRVEESLYLDGDGKGGIEFEPISEDIEAIEAIEEKQALQAMPSLKQHFKGKETIKNSDSVGALFDHESLGSGDLLIMQHSHTPAKKYVVVHNPLTDGAAYEKHLGIQKKIGMEEDRGKRIPLQPIVNKGRKRSASRKKNERETRSNINSSSSIKAKEGNAKNVGRMSSLNQATQESQANLRALVNILKTFDLYHHAIRTRDPSVDVDKMFKTFQTTFQSHRLIRRKFDRLFNYLNQHFYRLVLPRKDVIEFFFVWLITLKDHNNRYESFEDLTHEKMRRLVASLLKSLPEESINLLVRLRKGLWKKDPRITVINSGQLRRAKFSIKSAETPPFESSSPIRIKPRIHDVRNYEKIEVPVRNGRLYMQGGYVLSRFNFQLENFRDWNGKIKSVVYWDHYEEKLFFAYVDREKGKKEAAVFNRALHYGLTNLIEVRQLDDEDNTILTRIAQTYTTHELLQGFYQIEDTILFTLIFGDTDRIINQHHNSFSKTFKNKKY
ncbi:MAG: hypothetical protein KC733_12420, partial [Candidatus Omnitrophica bacterium]|nr:hypothetical protein [Candidatus Omnitrophota bacterium]